MLLTLDVALDAFEQMALDEAVLELAAVGELVLRFYRWAGPAVTFGYSQPFAFAQEAARRRGLPGAPLARRATGGGVVFHDGDVTFSLVFPWPRLSAACLVYKDLHRGIHAALKSAGVSTALWSPGGPEPPSVLKECFASPEPIDLVDAAGRKVLGGALRRRAGRGLYQGSLRPQTLGLPDSAVETAVLAGVAAQWGRQPRLDLEPSWLERAEQLAAKYRGDGWNRRR